MKLQTVFTVLSWRSTKCTCDRLWSRTAHPTRHATGLGTLREDFSHIQLGLVRQPRCQRRWHEKRLPWLGCTVGSARSISHKCSTSETTSLFRADVQLFYQPGSLLAPRSAVVFGGAGGVVVGVVVVVVFVVFVCLLACLRVCLCVCFGMLVLVC